jgi:hypothetical protein
MPKSRARKRQLEVGPADRRRDADPAVEIANKLAAPRPSRDARRRLVPPAPPRSGHKGQPCRLPPDGTVDRRFEHPSASCSGPRRRRSERRARSPDSQHLQLHAEEAGTFVRALVEPVDRLPMLLVEGRCDPHDQAGICAGCIGQQLTQVDVIRRSELVFDHYHRVPTQISTDEIELELPYRVLRRVELQIDAEGFSQFVGVLKEPRREVALLVGPYRSRVDARKAPQDGLVHARMLRTPTSWGATATSSRIGGVLLQRECRIPRSAATVLRDWQRSVLVDGVTTPAVGRVVVALTTCDASDRRVRARDADVVALDGHRLAPSPGMLGWPPRLGRLGDGHRRARRAVRAQP